MKKITVSVLFLAVLFFVPLAITHADDAISGDASQKLNQVLENQKQIMDSLEQIKGELQIIKVRATR